MTEEKIQNKEKVKALIENTTGEEVKVIAVPIELIHFMGKINSRGKTQKAVFFAQLIYWSDKGTRRDGFIYKTQKEWSRETGLSEEQISDYTEELELFGLIETKLKKANGSPTGHYKVNMTFFLDSFKEFLRNRIRENKENQIGENENSLTENTTKNTTDISLSKINSNFEREKNESEEKVIISEKIFSLYGNIASDKVIDNFNLGERILLPENFIPTWDKQFRAIMEFPDVSPATFTEKFVRKNLQNNKRKTLFKWNELWWDWIEREVPIYIGNVELEKERDEIFNRVYNNVYKITFWDGVGKVISRDDFYQKCHIYLSKKTVDDCLKLLVESESFGQVSNYYFNLDKYNESLEWKEKIDEELNKLGLIYVEKSA